MKKIFNIIAWIIFSMIFAGILLHSYWLFYPFEVFTFPRENLIVLNENKTVRAGEDLILFGETIHHTNGIQVETSPQLVNGVVVQFPLVSYVTTEGLFSATRNIKIPDYINAGTYKMQFNISVKINPVRTMTFIRNSDEFYIVK